jgi:hypothetical protein
MGFESEAPQGSLIKLVKQISRWLGVIINGLLRQKGINVSDVTQLDRLLYIGSKGMGALTYEPDHSEPESYNNLDLSSLSNEAGEVYVFILFFTK